MRAQPDVTVGQPRPRVDGRAKVTGRASFAADHGRPHGLEDVAHAVLVSSTVARGRVAALDVTAALAVPDVIRVLCHTNAPRLPYLDDRGGAGTPPGERLRVLQDDRVFFHGQPVAVVVAGTLEAAQHAARLVRVRYDAEDPVTDLAAAPADEPLTYARGDVEAALDAAPVRLDLDFRLARNHHNPIEPHATVARWEGDRLTVWDKTQWVMGTQQELSTAFGVPRDHVRVLSPYVGGAFGSALRCWPHVTLAALAAREVGRPVKLVLTRRQMYTGTGFRPAYDYRLRLGADRDGRILAADHDIRSETSRYETFTEGVTSPGQVLYRTPHVRQTYRTVPLDVNTPTWMRGPGWGTGAHVLETALDELAHELGIDPIDLRRRNEPDVDEVSGRPFSSRRLLECYAVGAREFGWERRDREPRSSRDGDWLVGSGVASAVYGTLRAAARAAVRLDADGTAVVASATSDMGPGTSTSMSQVAADELGLDLDDVAFRLGDSTLPVAPLHAGSKTMASVGSAVLDGARQVREAAVARAVGDPRSPLHRLDPADVVVVHGVLRHRDDPARQDSYRDLLARHGGAPIEAVGSYDPPEQETHATAAYGAVFAEVGVDVDLGLVRVRRLLAVYDVGRVVNPRLAESQAIGGMVGGLGSALLEHTRADHRDGRVVNADLADYLVPVSADVGELRALFLEGRDDLADPIGVKGLGEVVQVGIAPALANAVFHATGRRIRELPISIEHLL